MQPQKRFNLSATLDAMNNPPHTIEVSQYKRGDGTIALTYKAHFKIEKSVMEFGAAIFLILAELQQKQIQRKRSDVAWMMFNEGKAFNVEKTKICEATLIVELITPDQLAEKATRDEEFFGAMKEHFQSSRTVDGAVVE